MILLDSDHLTVLRFPSSERCKCLIAKLASAKDTLIGTTIINVEEAVRGWMAAIAKERLAHRQIFAYRELECLFTCFRSLHIAPFDKSAADYFENLRASKLRVGSMDLKTASIVIVQYALLLTANTRDFEKVPGLRFENWLA